MPLMRYKAVDVRGRKLTGELEAANAIDLEARLSRTSSPIGSSR